MGDIRLRDLAETLTFPGLWRFIARYPGVTFSEFGRSLSKKLFCESLQRLVPAVQLEDLTPGGAGVRAQAMGADGTLLQDFAIRRAPGALHVLNAPSPGATSSLTIGGHLTDLIAQN